MEYHPDFARGQITKLGINGKEKFEKMWIDLKNNLSLLGSTKSVEQWKKIWKEIRLQAKNKVAEYKSAKKRTGNIEPLIEISENDMKISDIFGEPGLGLPIIDCGVPDFKKERRNHASPEQWEHLLKTMENNKMLAKETLKAGALREMWERLGEELNQLVGATRAAPEWRKSYHELKVRAEAKLKDLTNGKLVLPLNARELRVLKCLGIENLEEVLASTSKSVAQKSSTNKENRGKVKVQRPPPLSPSGKLKLSHISYLLSNDLPGQDEKDSDDDDEDLKIAIENSKAEQLVSCASYSSNNTTARALKRKIKSSPADDKTEDSENVIVIEDDSDLQPNFLSKKPRIQKPQKVAEVFEDTVSSHTDRLIESSEKRTNVLREIRDVLRDIHTTLSNKNTEILTFSDEDSKIFTMT